MSFIVTRLNFSQPRIVLAAVIGAVFVFGCGYMIIDSLVWFTDRYEAGNASRKLFSALSYQTNGWAGAIFFALFGGYLVRPWIAAMRRLGRGSYALAITESTLRVHSSFGLNRSEFPLNDVSGLELTTEGEALSSSQRIVTSFVPLGSQWLVSLSMKKVCLLFFVNDGNEKPKKVHVSAQFVHGGAASLEQFYHTLRADQAAIPSMKSTCTPS